jgi:hypothetical protein
MVLAGPAFSQNIWKELIHETQAVRAVMQRIYERADEQLTPIVTAFTYLDAPVVSAFWVDTALAECAAKKSHNVIYCCSVICAMIVSHNFHVGEPLRNLIYQTTKLRLIYEQDVLVRCAGLIAALVHMLIRLSRTSLTIDFTVVSAAFWSAPTLADFISGKSKRNWLALSMALASAFRDAVVDLQFSNLLYRKFMEDLESSELAVRVNAFIFAGAFAGENSAQFLDAAIRALRQEKDERFVSAISFALSQLKMNDQMASKLFFLGLCLTLYLRSSPGLSLIASAVKQLGPNKPLLGTIPIQCVLNLSHKSLLDFAQYPVFSALLLMGTFAGPQDEVAIKDFLSSGIENPLAMVFSLVFGPENAEKVKAIDFGEQVGSVGIVVLRLLTVMPKPDLINFAIELANRRPSIFTGIPIWQSELGMDLVKAVDHPGLFAALAYAMFETPAENQFTIAPILKTIYQTADKEQFLDADSLDSLIGQVFGGP